MADFSVTASLAFSGFLHVVALTQNGAQCATAEGAEPFWLPRKGHVRWAREPVAGRTVSAVIPAWLAAKHRQLAGDVVFERVKYANSNTQKDLTMTYAGKDNSGALFRVPDDEKKTDKWPDYKGDVLINGAKWWISGWLRTSEKTGKKYLSLALRVADEVGKPAPAAKAAARAPVNDDFPV